MNKRLGAYLMKKAPHMLAFVPLIVFGLMILALALVLEQGSGEKVKFTQLVDKPAPTTVLPILGKNQKYISTQDWKEKKYIVNFFASWCVPCREEHEFLLRLMENNIAVIGIAYKDNSKAVRGFLRVAGNPFRVVGEDTTGHAGIDWGITGVPETYIVDKAGIIRYHHSGPLTDDIIERELLPTWRDLK